MFAVAAVARTAVSNVIILVYLIGDHGTLLSHRWMDGWMDGWMDR